MEEPMHQKKSVSFLAILAACCLVSCTDEAITFCENGDCGSHETCVGDNCGQTNHDTCQDDNCDNTCTGEDCDEKPIEYDTCSHACEPDDKKCDGSHIQVCVTDNDGCRGWSQPVDCGHNMICDPSTNRCIEGCVDACNLGDVECRGAEFVTCIKDDEENSCTHWSLPTSCGENQHCDEETHTCVGGCIDECTQNSAECADEEIRYCGQFDDDPCLEFGPSDDCGTDMICDKSSNSCIRLGCDVECTAGETKCNEGDTALMVCNPIAGSSCNTWDILETCSENKTCVDKNGALTCAVTVLNCNPGEKKCSDTSNALLTCIENDEGNAWQESPCASNQVCDHAKAACALTCTDACTENQTQCTSNNKGTQICKRGSNGCTSWVAHETCGSAQTCNAGKCQSNCGSNCEPFSIVIIPDTQNYTRYDSVKSTTYHKQMQWIVDNKNNKDILPNLKMVVHMGDITNDNTDVQWKIAKDAQNILFDNKIPFTVVNGNHDYRVSGKIGGRSKTKFATYFPESYLKKVVGYGGIYDKVNTYSNFTAGNQDYLVLNLEFAPRQETICWANRLLQKPENQNKKVIITTHANVSHKKEGNTKPSYGGKPKNQFVANGASGSELWTELTSRHSNIIMILNGHVGDSERREDKGNNGNYVQQILTDYQFEKPCTANKLSGCTASCQHAVGAGNGWLRILTFYPAENRVHAKSISVVSGSTSFFSKQGTDQFFCSPLFDMSNKGVTCNDCGQWYPQSPSHDDHEYDITFDFTTPMVNRYNDKGYLGFVHRNINATSTGDQLKPVVAMNDTGSLVYVWEDDSDDSDGNITTSSNHAHDIYARVMMPESCAISGNSEIIVNVKTEGHQSEPDVAMDKDGNFVVVWTDDHDNNGSTQIYMRGFYADGSERFSTKTVNTVDTRNQYQPKIAMAADGQFAVSWTDTASSKDTPQINVRGFKADGKQAFAQRAIADEVKGSRVKSDIFMDNAHNIIVAWEDDEDGNGSTQVRMRILDASGNNKTGVKTVNSTSKGDQNMPSVSGKPDGSEFIVVWQNVATSTNYSIMGRTFNASGAQIDADFTLSTSAVSQKVTDPHVCMNAKGEAKAVWYNPTPKDIKMRAFEKGAPAGSEEARVNSPGNEKANNSIAYETAKSYQPSIACTPSGDFAAITFADDNDGNSAFEIFAVGTKITKTSI